MRTDGNDVVADRRIGARHRRDAGRLQIDLRTNSACAATSRARRTPTPHLVALFPAPPPPLVAHPSLSIFAIFSFFPIDKTVICLLKSSLSPPNPRDRKAGAVPPRSTPRTTTPRGTARAEVLAFVRERLAAGAPPTVREVQQALGFKAVESARQHLESLVAEGKLAKEPGRSRGYRLPASGGRLPDVRLVPQVRLIPQLGRVQAGGPREAIEDPDGWLAVEGPQSEEELFALTVRGESMTGAGILPGDVVVVRRQDTARDGEIVVALVRDEATVKRLRLRDGQVVLQPENPAFAPLVFAPAVSGPDMEIRILGRVVEVRRRLA